MTTTSSSNCPPDPSAGRWSTNHVLGLFLVLLAFFTVLTNVALLQEDRDLRESDIEQRECLSDQFHDLSDALEVRAVASERESAAARRIWSVYAEAAGLVKDDPTKELKPKDKERLQRELVVALLDYQDVQDEIEADREANPIPPYPEGECDPDSK